MKTRKPLKREKPLARGRPMKRGGRIKPKKRSADEFKRVYGSAERVAWIKTLPCVGCRNTSHDGHHIAGDGIGRKEHHSLIVPVCRTCHQYIHNHGARAFESMYRVSLATAAEQTAKAWYQLETGLPWHSATPHEEEA